MREELVADLKCKVYERKMSQRIESSWIWNGIRLKEVVTSEDISVNWEAKKVEFDFPLSEDLFHFAPTVEVISDSESKKRSQLAFEKSIKGPKVDVTYYPNGNKKTEIHTTDGLRDGESLKFHEDGSIRSHATFQKGQPYGVQKDYWPNGKIQFEITFKDHVQSRIKSFDEDGNLIHDSTGQGAIITTPKLPESYPIKQSVTLPKNAHKMVRVSYLQNAESKELAGFIYIDTGGTATADKVLKIKRARKWQFMESSGKTGLYDQEISAGGIDENGVLLELPAKTFVGAANIWKAGWIDGFIGNQEISAHK